MAGMTKGERGEGKRRLTREEIEQATMRGGFPVIAPHVRRFANGQKLEALQRELKFRRRVYPQRIERRLMTRQLADYQIAVFEEISAEYDEKAGAERLI